MRHPCLILFDIRLGSWLCTHAMHRRTLCLHCAKERFTARDMCIDTSTDISTNACMDTGIDMHTHVHPRIVRPRIVLPRLPAPPCAGTARARTSVRVGGAHASMRACAHGRIICMPHACGAGRRARKTHACTYICVPMPLLGTTSR